jgi:hypothetical protein
LVEAKDAGRKLGGYDEQLGDYFGKAQPDVKLEPVIDLCAADSSS